MVCASNDSKDRTLTSRLTRFAPGLPALLGYRRADFPHDLIAGLSVAAVALPVGVAYAQLAGFNPVVGLYVSILPLVAYALFGTSRQLIVGPDAATCALVAAAVTPLAAGDPALYLSLTMAMTALAGLLCIGASFLRLGAVADFLSVPMPAPFEMSTPASANGRQRRAVMWIGGTSCLFLTTGKNHYVNWAVRGPSWAQSGPCCRRRHSCRSTRPRGQRGCAVTARRTGRTAAGSSHCRHKRSRQSHAA